MTAEEIKPSNPDLHKGAVSMLQDRTTLRDYFAGLAMRGLINKMEVEFIRNPEYYDFFGLTENSYKISDMMLKQREL